MDPNVAEMMRAARRQAEAEGRVTEAGTVCNTRERAAYVNYAEKYGPNQAVFDALGRPQAH